jgi:hypothetical protein
MDKLLSLSEIRHRRVELSREAESLRKRLSEISTSIHELGAVEEIIARYGKEVPDAGDSKATKVEMRGVLVDQDRFERTNIGRTALGAKPPETIKSIMVTVMRSMPDIWTTARELQARVSEIKGREVPMSTISPTLSELKSDDLLARDGMKIALNERLKEIEPSTGGSGDGSEKAQVRA